MVRIWGIATSLQTRAIDQVGDLPGERSPPVAPSAGVLRNPRRETVAGAAALHPTDPLVCGPQANDDAIWHPTTITPTSVVGRSRRSH
jgi:hypothetical protein